MSIASLIQDLRYTFRTLRRDAGFAVFAIAIAGLEVLTRKTCTIWVKFFGQDRPRVSGALSRNAT